MLDFFFVFMYSLGFVKYLMGVRPALLDPLPLSASHWETVVKLRGRHAPDELTFYDKGDGSPSHCVIQESILSGWEKNYPGRLDD